MMERLVIACMDRRLNRYLDGFNDGRTVFLRNAGGNVHSLERSIRQIAGGKIRQVHVVVHTDCGAMRVVSGARDGSLMVSDRIKLGLLQDFDGVKFGSREELEQANEQLQHGSVTKLVAHSVGVTSELVDISRLARHQGTGEHVLSVTRASGERYSKIAQVSGTDIDEMYTVQANSMDEILHDIEIATGMLGIQRVQMIALEASEVGEVHARTTLVKGAPFMGGSVQVEQFRA